MAKNKHNQVHADNQSGKTDYFIASLLPVGKENAISTKNLVQLVGCNSARELQQYIANERNHGAIICSGSGNGYWKPKNRQEIVEFCRTMDARAKHTWAAAGSAKQALKTMGGGWKCKAGIENDGRAAGVWGGNRVWRIEECSAWM